MTVQSATCPSHISWKGWPSSHVSMAEQGARPLAVPCRAPPAPRSGPLRQLSPRGLPASCPIRCGAPGPSVPWFPRALRTAVDERGVVVTRAASAFAVTNTVMWFPPRFGVPRP